MDANEQVSGLNDPPYAESEILPKRGRGRPPGTRARVTRVKAICENLLRQLELESASSTRDAGLRCKHLSAALVTLLPYVDRASARNTNGTKPKPINVLGMGE